MPDFLETAVRLIRFEFSEGDSGWALPGMDFDPGLNLLVGVSGVGKTRILKSLFEVVRAARSRATELWGASWSLLFQIGDGKTYKWSASLEAQPDGSAGVGQEMEPGADVRRARPQPKFLSESLACVGGEVLVERESENIRLRGKETPKLSPDESVLFLLREEDAIRDVSRSFDRVVFTDHSSSMNRLLAVSSSTVERFKGEVGDHSVESLRNTQASTTEKMVLLQESHADEFQSLVGRFIEVFPSIEKVAYEQERDFRLRPTWVLKIKERGVRNWIPRNRISSGMYTTWMHLGRLAVWPDGTVYLIDEFETSLGVNCIDFITEDVVNESRRMQFVITSHHPYIINNIDPKYWKLVSRTGSVVGVMDAMVGSSDKSSHDEFIKLINSDKYRNGIASI